MQQIGQWFAIQTPLLQGLMVFLGCYLIGCFASGYYLVRWRAGIDVRQMGSGSVGATNVRRALGPTGFVVTLLADIIKGAFALWFTKEIAPAGWLGVLALLAVVAGHIWPVQLRFQGGKGIATALGALLVYDWLMLLIWAGAMAVSYLLLRRFVVAGLIAFVAVPVAALATHAAAIQSAGLTLLVGLVWFAHRSNVHEEFAIMFKHRVATSESDNISH